MPLDLGKEVYRSEKEARTQLQHEVENMGNDGHIFMDVREYPNGRYKRTSEHPSCAFSVSPCSPCKTLFS
jgi:hypothetical protein